MFVLADVLDDLLIHRHKINRHPPAHPKPPTEKFSDPLGAGHHTPHAVAPELSHPPFLMRQKASKPQLSCGSQGARRLDGSSPGLRTSQKVPCGTEKEADSHTLRMRLSHSESCQKRTGRRAATMPKSPPWITRQTRVTMRRQVSRDRTGGPVGSVKRGGTVAWRNEWLEEWMAGGHAGMWRRGPLDDRYPRTAIEFREWLGRVGLSQGAAAGWLGMSRTQVERLLAGKRPIRRQVSLACVQIEEELRRERRAAEKADRLAA